ncbi:MAG: DUF4407 domain-containing protein [Bacteroidota bacterium]
MMEHTSGILPGDSYAAGKFEKFLWWLSTAEEALIEKAVLDRNRYAITGMTVLGTWLFATLAWSYFFSTVVSEIWAALALGIFMGGVILGIDRALIKGINRNNKHKIIPIGFRVVLAFTIGLFMAQPALLYLFNKEIHTQISIDNEQRKRIKLQRQDSVYAGIKQPLLGQRNQLRAQLMAKDKEVSAARESFIAETDGTGGSKKIGLKDIAKAKQAAYLKLQNDYSLLEQLLMPSIRAADSSLSNIDAGIFKEQAAFETLLNDGFITRIEALNNLIQNNSAVAFRYYLLVAILMLIELMPVIAKTLLPTGTYDEHARLREAYEIKSLQQLYQKATEDLDNK